MICPLCQGQKLIQWDQDKERTYWCCETCRLVSVPREQLLSSKEEEKRYNFHQIDSGHQKYLEGIYSLILPHISTDMTGLDFGCGKTKSLEALFECSGFSMDSYDLYFYPDESIWKRKYDYIILSEVIEHLVDLMKVMSSLRSLLKTNGQFFIKTKFYPLEKKQFEGWFYKRDLTHIQFFCPAAMRRLAIQLEMGRPQELGQDITRLVSLR